MALLLLSIGLAMAAFIVVRPVVEGSPAPLPAAFDSRGLLGAFTVVFPIAVVWGVETVLALTVALGLRELGTGLGRSLAYGGAPWVRLVPTLPTRLWHPYEAPLAAAFTLFSGAVVSLPPMAAALTLAPMLAESAPKAAHTLLTFVHVCGALNLLLLLPVWPLPGGKLARALIEAHSPGTGRTAAAISAAFTVGLALTLQSALMLLVGTAGALLAGLRPAPDTRVTRPVAGHVVLVVTLWTVLVLAHALTGAWAFSLYRIG